MRKTQKWPPLRKNHRTPKLHPHQKPNPHQNRRKHQKPHPSPNHIQRPFQTKLIKPLPMPNFPSSPTPHPIPPLLLPVLQAAEESHSPHLAASPSGSRDNTLLPADFGKRLFSILPGRRPPKNPTLLTGWLTSRLQGRYASSGGFWKPPVLDSSRPTGRRRILVPLRFPLSESGPPGEAYLPWSRPDHHPNRDPAPLHSQHLLTTAQILSKSSTLSFVSLGRQIPFSKICPQML